jgi:ABC-type transport system involved in Fe-S cluster assembly fused permease/ATPase subunit
MLVDCNLRARSNSRIIVIKIHKVVSHRNHCQLIPAKRIEHTVFTNKFGSVNRVLSTITYQCGIPVILSLIIGPTVADSEDAQNLVVKTGKIKFKDVSFAYDPRKQIIKRVSFSVEGGETVAFGGETGGSQSTIMKLLFRFYDAKNDSILIDG